MGARPAPSFRGHDGGVAHRARHAGRHDAGDGAVRPVGVEPGAVGQVGGHWRRPGVGAVAGAAVAAPREDGPPLVHQRPRDGGADRDGVGRRGWRRAVGARADPATAAAAIVSRTASVRMALLLLPSVVFREHPSGPTAPALSTIGERGTGRCPEEVRVRPARYGCFCTRKLMLPRAFCSETRIFHPPAAPGSVSKVPLAASERE
jgi:hypothetical protein